MRAKTPTTSPADLVDNFGHYAIDVARLIRRCTDLLLREAEPELPSAEIRALCYVAAFPGERQHQLAERMGIEPVTFVTHLDHLESVGLVARETAADDRRAKVVKLLPPAHAIVATVVALSRRIRASATRGFSDDEITMLSALLVRLRANLIAIEAAYRRKLGRRPRRAVVRGRHGMTSRDPAAPAR